MAKTAICDICGIESKCIYRHKIWCQNKHDFLNYYNLTKEIIQEEYIRLGSIQGFISEYSNVLTNNSKYYRLFQELDIDYSLSKSASSQSTRKKTRQTCLEKYGYEHNFQKDSSSRIEWESRLLKEEGITNVFQRESVKKKSQNTIIKRYGSNSRRAKITQRGNSCSSLNLWLYRVLNDLKIEYKPEFPLQRHKGIYYYDCLLWSHKLIEVNGDYWHGNPNIYKPNDIILKGSKTGEMMVKDKWAADNRKIKFAENLGFLVLTIWELDIKSNENQVIQRIKEYAKSKN